VVVSERRVCAIFLGKKEEGEIAAFTSKCPRTTRVTKGKSTLLSSVFESLRRYLRGELKSFDLPTEFLFGSPFQRKVWNALKTIPYGRCVSYQWVAKEIGHPRAMRAVGNAVGSNPLPILVPCHRVIRKDGSLGGFSSGLEIKKALLKIEGCLQPIKESP